MNLNDEKLDLIENAIREGAHNSKLLVKKLKIPKTGLIYYLQKLIKSGRIVNLNPQGSRFGANYQVTTKEQRQEFANGTLNFSAGTPTILDDDETPEFRRIRILYSQLGDAIQAASKCVIPAKQKKMLVDIGIRLNGKAE